MAQFTHDDDPSPEQIRKACARIREGWSTVEHYRRAGEPVPWFMLVDRSGAKHQAIWEPPEMKVPQVPTRD